MPPEATFLRLLVTVKAYPSPSVKYDETVCCAGITEQMNWVRLYPIPYRDLPGARQFKKYDVIEVMAARPDPWKDNRPESWRPKLETLKVVDHLESSNNWSARLEWIRPTVLPGYTALCSLQRSQNKSLC